MEGLKQAKFECLGTVIEISVPSSFISLCQKELQRIENTYSRFIDSSQISQMNNALGKWHAITPEMHHILARAQEFHKKTDGFFDITIKEHLDILGYDSKYTFAPIHRKRSYFEQLSHTLFPPVSLRKDKVLLRKEIDFGGLGKGFALDSLASLLERQSARSYYLNFGGDIFAKRGNKKKPWTILLEHPDDPKRIIGETDLDNMALTCSAPNRRKWRGYHHLLNPKTGQPQMEMKCVFVQAKTGIEADGYATALFTAGFEKAQQMLKTLPVDALLISKEGKIFITPAFKVRFYE